MFILNTDKSFRIGKKKNSNSLLCWSCKFAELCLASVENCTYAFLPWNPIFCLKTRKKNHRYSQTIGGYRLDLIHSQNSFFSQLSIFFIFNFWAKEAFTKQAYLFSLYLSRFWSWFCILCMKYSNFLPALHKPFQNAFEKKWREDWKKCTIYFFVYSSENKNIPSVPDNQIVGNNLEKKNNNRKHKN